MKPISYFEFNRKKFLKSLKHRFEINLIVCKLFKTGNLKIATLNYKRIYDKVNDMLQRKSIFDNNNIFLIIQTLDIYNEFIKEFAESIKTTEDIDALKDRQISFFQKQAELENFCKKNSSHPISVVL